MEPSEQEKRTENLRQKLCIRDPTLKHSSQVFSPPMGRKEGRHNASKLFISTVYLHKGVHIVVLSIDILLRT
jgi:hypothetical protein